MKTTFTKFASETDPATCVGDERHVHFVSGVTTEVEDHEHDFIFATLIEDPIGD